MASQSLPPPPLTCSTPPPIDFGPDDDEDPFPDDQSEDLPSFGDDGMLVWECRWIDLLIDYQFQVFPKRFPTIPSTSLRLR